MTLQPESTSSIDLIKAALLPLGFTSESITLGGSRYTIVTAPTGFKWFVQDAHISYPFTTAATQKVSRDKHLAHELSDSLGIISPTTYKVSGHITQEEREAMLANAPLVVKPSNASLSNGVTLQVRTLPDLENALAIAHAFSPIALVQHQIDGDEIRFVMINGQAKAAMLRQTPRVIGDGKSTLAELIAVENQARAKIVTPYLDYPQLDQRIIDFTAFDMAAVPAASEVVELGRGSMIKSGASVYEVLDTIDNSYKIIAEQLAAALGSSFIVVDIIIADYRQPASPDNYAFLEFNTSPVIKLFYACRDGKHFDVLSYLAPMIQQLSEVGHV